MRLSADHRRSNCPLVLDVYRRFHSVNFAAVPVHLFFPVCDGERGPAAHGVSDVSETVTNSRVRDLVQFSLLVRVSSAGPWVLGRWRIEDS